MLDEFSIPVSLQEVEASPQYSSEELTEGGLLEGTWLAALYYI